MGAGRPAEVAPNNALARKIEELRESRNMTRLQVYNAAGVSKNQYTRLLTKTSQLDPGVAVKVGGVFGIEPLEVFRLIRIAVVPDGTERTLTVTEASQLSQAS